MDKEKIDSQTLPFENIFQLILIKLKSHMEEIIFLERELLRLRKAILSRLPPFQIIQHYKTLQPSLNRIKSTSEWKSIPEPLSSLLKRRKEPLRHFSHRIPHAYTSIPFFSKPICTRILYQQPPAYFHNISAPL